MGIHQEQLSGGLERTLMKTRWEQVLVMLVKLLQAADPGLSNV